METKTLIQSILSERYRSKYLAVGSNAVANVIDDVLAGKEQRFFPGSGGHNIDISPILQDFANIVTVLSAMISVVVYLNTRPVPTLEEKVRDIVERTLKVKEAELTAEERNELAREILERLRREQQE